MIYRTIINKLLTLSAICVGVYFCAPVEKKEVVDVTAVPMGFDPASELPDLTAELKDHRSRIDVELKFYRMEEVIRNLESGSSMN